MEERRIDILSAQSKEIRRESDNLYWQSVSFEHLWKEIEDGLTENIFIITVGDQFFNSATNQAYLNGLEVHFRVIARERILHGYSIPLKRHPEAIPCISAMTFEAMKMLREVTLLNFDKSQFHNIELPDLTEQLVTEIVTKSLPK